MSFVSTWHNYSEIQGLVQASVYEMDDHRKRIQDLHSKGEALDDLRMMQEVVERWIKRVEDWPDLLLIDGGETHLAIISKLLQKHGVSDRMELASLAKQEETIHREGHDDIVLDRRGRLLVHARMKHIVLSTNSTGKTEQRKDSPIHWKASVV